MVRQTCRIATPLKAQTCRQRGVSSREEEEEEEEESAPEAECRLLNGGDVWALWVVANREAGRRDPIKGGNLKAAQRLAHMVRDGTLTEGELTDSLRTFLADDEPFLVKNGHGLRFLSDSKLDAYRNAAPADPQGAAAFERMEGDGTLEAIEQRAQAVEAARGKRGEA